MRDRAGLVALDRCASATSEGGALAVAPGPLLGTLHHGGLGGIDRLTGGGGHDLYEMQGNHFGYEIITDFVTGGSELDAVSFQNTTVHSFANVLTNSVQIGADTYIGDGLGNEVVLVNVSRASLTADNFGFIG